GFCKSQEEACSVELSSAMHEASQHRDYSPGDHDSCNPFPCAPPFDNNGSWYLEQKIGQVKNAYAEAIHAITETQVSAHSEIGEGNVDAIDVVHDVHEEHERKQAVRNSPSCANANCWQAPDQGHDVARAIRAFYQNGGWLKRHSVIALQRAAEAPLNRV